MTKFSINMRSITSITYNKRPFLEKTLILKSPFNYIIGKYEKQIKLDMNKFSTTFTLSELAYNLPLPIIINNSPNKCVKSSIYFSQINNTFVGILPINKDFFDENNKTLNVKYSMSLKYTGIFQKCNDFPNVLLDGNFTLVFENNEYKLVNHNIMNITYEGNDFCSDYLSYNYYYDICDDKIEDVDIDNQECIELNIYNIINDMFKTSEIVQTDNSIEVNFSMDDFYGKISSPIMTYEYRKIDSLSRLLFKFLFTKDAFITLTNSDGEFIRQLYTSNSNYLIGLTTGDIISVRIIDGTIFIDVKTKCGNIV